jgi:endonuclease/exonuclease/phosphatase family metal-dependent hydrolase
MGPDSWNLREVSLNHNSHEQHQGPTAPRPLRLGVWNIHGGKGIDRHLNLDRTASFLAGFDLVGLNEVRGGFPFEVPLFETGDQARLLGSRLSVDGRFLPYETRYGRPHFGNGVLCRRKLTAGIVAPLPHSRVKGHGNVSVLSLPAWSGEVRVMLTHIDHRQDRRQQLEYVINWFRGLEAPCVLMGDLNTRADDPLLTPLLEDRNVVDALGELSLNADIAANRIDWLLARGLRVVSAGCEMTDASDHPLLWAEFLPRQTIPLAASLSPIQPGGIQGMSAEDSGTVRR